jgi:hypothetical protein
LAGVRGVDLATTSEAVLRWVRALTLPSLLFTSALAGHAAGDGVTPGTSALVALFLLTVIAVAPFTVAPIRPAPAVALLLIGQGLLHAALQLLDGTAVTATTALCGAGTRVAAVSAPTSCHMMTHPGGAVMSHGSAMSLMGGGHLVMLLAHLAAAVVVGAWLAGERAFWTVLGFAARPVVDAWRTLTSTGRGTAGAVVVSCPRLQLGWGLRCAVRGSVWTAGVVSRRGPPGAASPEPYAYAAASTV